MTEEAGIGDHFCILCQNRFLTCSDAQVHLINEHFSGVQAVSTEEKEELKPLVESDGPKIIKEEFSEDTPPSFPHSFKCSECDNLFSDSNSYLSHIATHESTAEECSSKVFFCESCHKKLSTSSLFMKHLTLKHRIDHVDNDARSGIKCKLCDDVLNTNSAFWKHYVQKHDELTFRHENEAYVKVTFCCDKFWNEEERLEHVLEQHENKPLFLSDSRETEKQEESSTSEVRSNEQATNSDKRLPCPKCSVKLANAASLSRHLKSKHSTPSKGEKIKPQCHVCGMTFCRDAKLKLHMQRKHEKKEHVPCPVCGKKYHKLHLEGHMKALHPTDEEGEATNRCHICKKRFITSTTLTWHIRGVHENQRPYSCDICGKTFRQKGSLTTHVRGVHKGEKLAKCPDCGRRFQRPSLLKEHREDEHGYVSD